MQLECQKAYPNLQLSGSLSITGHPDTSKKYLEHCF